LRTPKVGLKEEKSRSRNLSKNLLCTKNHDRARPIVRFLFPARPEKRVVEKNKIPRGRLVWGETAHSRRKKADISGKNQENHPTVVTASVRRPGEKGSQKGGEERGDILSAKRKVLTSWGTKRETH